MLYTEITLFRQNAVLAPAQDPSEKWGGTAWAAAGRECMSKFW